MQQVQIALSSYNPSYQHVSYSLILGDVRDVTFGRVWVGFTFLFFSPVIYFTITLFIDLVTSALDLWIKPSTPNKPNNIWNGDLSNLL